MAFKKMGVGLLVFVLLMIAGCSNSNESSSAESAGSDSKETVNIDFSLFPSENDMFSVYFRDWAKQIEEETDGRVTITPYYSGQLSSLFETLDSVRNGTVDGGLLSAGAISGDIASMGLLEVFGVFQNGEDFRGFYDESGEFLHQIFQDNGVQLSMWTTGGNQFLFLDQDEFLKSPDQFDGLKFRTAGKWQAEQVEELGATPLTLDPGELYLALQNRTVDTTAQTVNLTEAFKLYEVAPKLSLAKLALNANFFVFNPDVWSKISEEDQETIQNISKEMGMNSYEFFIEKENEILENIQNNGAELYTLTDEEHAVLLDKFQAVIPEIAESVGDEGKELHEILKKYQ
ncbi:TRAP transporter substrate-binding protein [Siminovitchia sediminis]|uniref:TRAP transporter substrate-binding protein n=1 Tax=Siminovitchia sediminis TaxID=1274353 RepID=A0ABW4KIF9_9BACI